MEHAAVLEPPGFSGLSKDEQIRYVQSLWDRVSAAPDEIPVKESHLDLARDRLESYRRDPSRARPAHEILERLASRR